MRSQWIFGERFFGRGFRERREGSPSRGGFMTGRTPSRYGSYKYGHATRTEEITLGELAKSAGYATGHYGKRGACPTVFWGLG